MRHFCHRCGNTILAEPSALEVRGERRAQICPPILLCPGCDDSFVNWFRGRTGNMAGLQRPPCRPGSRFEPAVI
jgi:hypothetical protein